MNAEVVGKPLKGLALASTLALMTSMPAFAQDVTVSLGAQATTPLTALYLNPPSGSVTLGGKPFNMGNFDWLAPGDSGTFAAAYPGPTGVYLLLNSSYTWSGYAGVKVGSVQLTFNDGTSQSVDLVVGNNVREWQVGAGGVVNTVSNASNSNVWMGYCCSGSTQAAIDMLTLPVTANGRSLASVTVSNSDSTGWGLHLQVYGIAVSYTPLVVAPAPTPSVSGNPDNNGKHLGQIKNPNEHNDQAKALAKGFGKQGE
jgi:hypothetical protein